MKFVRLYTNQGAVGINLEPNHAAKTITLRITEGPMMLQMMPSLIMERHSAQSLMTALKEIIDAG